MRFAARRALRLVLGIAALIVASFLMVQLIPGDPARRIAGIDASPEFVEQMRQQLGLNDPLPVQFFHYISGVVTLDLGKSFRTHQSVLSIIFDRFPLTVGLAGTALVLVLLLSLTLGLIAAAFTQNGRHPHFENGFLVTTGTLAAVPEFLLGTYLVFLFSVTLRLLPVAGAAGPQSLILPSLAIAIPISAMLSRIVRVQAIDVLRAEYIRTARSKWLGSFRLYTGHVLPNVLTATLTISSLVFISLIGGSVIVENIFAWPGLGTAAVEAILNRDFPVIQGIILVLGSMVLVINTFVDVLLALIDPRSTIGEA